MITLMQQQMAQVMKLQEENSQLRAEGTPAPEAAAVTTTTTKKKDEKPRPTHCRCKHRRPRDGTLQGLMATIQNYEQHHNNRRHPHGTESRLLQGCQQTIRNCRSHNLWHKQQRQPPGTQCNEQAPSQPKEQPLPPPAPEVPFEQVAMDLCHLSGHLYLVYADRYSGWVKVAKLSNSTINSVRGALLAWFTTYGVPREIATDGGSPFQSSEYVKLLNDWCIVQDYRPPISPKATEGQNQQLRRQNESCSEAPTRLRDDLTCAKKQRPWWHTGIHLHRERIYRGGSFWTPHQRSPSN